MPEQVYRNMTRVKHLRAKQRCSDIMKAMNEQRDNKLYCDITLVARGKLFHAHRNILAASSNYFKSKFQSQGSDPFEKMLEIDGVSRLAMQHVLDFIYTNRVCVSINNVDEILYASWKMEILDLMKLVVQYIKDQLDPTTCLHFRDLGKTYSIDCIVKQADHCVRKHFEFVAQQDDFKALTISELNSVLQSHELVVTSEKVVYEALIRWVKYDLESRKPYFISLFQHLHLQLVDLEYLSDTIRRESLVRDNPLCRDLVENAFYFHAKPDKFKREKQRIHPCPANDIIFVPSIEVQMGSFNPKQGRWKSLEVTGTPIRNAAVVCGGKVYCFGCGIDPLSVKCFNGYEWKELPNMPTAHYGAAAQCIAGEILLFGGSCQKYPHAMSATNCISIYNPTTKLWSCVHGLTSFRTHATAVAVKDTAYLLGGFPQTEGKQENCKTECTKVEIYNKSSNTCDTTNSMLIPRASCAAVYKRGKIFVFGGLENVFVFHGEVLNVEDGVWSLLKSKIPFQLGHSSACYFGDYIVVYGSSTYGHVLLYNPGVDRWDIFVDYSPYKSFNGEGVLYVAGGEDNI
nr:kelch-like protein 12 isoform X1 [Ciona intestinalis]|eukprot:XP_018670316.1 kelch-like protein 12 isoform X1 [Ciona intestinalis]